MFGLQDLVFCFFCTFPNSFSSLEPDSFSVRPETVLDDPISKSEVAQAVWEKKSNTFHFSFCLLDPCPPLRTQADSEGRLHFNGEDLSAGAALRWLFSVKKPLLL